MNDACNQLLIGHRMIGQQSVQEEVQCSEWGTINNRANTPWMTCMPCFFSTQRITLNYTGFMAVYRSMSWSKCNWEQECHSDHISDTSILQHLLCWLLLTHLQHRFSQELMRAEGPKERPTENHALGHLALHYRIRQTTKFLTPIHNLQLLCNIMCA